MERGDFTTLAKAYVHRPGYALRVLQAIAALVSDGARDIVVADVGAGTGKLTRNLIQLGFHGFAVEPNDSMREEGMRWLVDERSFEWRKGTAEHTGLGDSSVHWVLMGSSFHWTDQGRAIEEFHRVLKPGGWLTVMWNPRDLDRSELQKRIDRRIHELVPGLARVSSGAASYTRGLPERLLAGGRFDDLIFMEAPHREVMTRERYLGLWRSVNDVQVQAGPEKFEEIMRMIEAELGDLQTVESPYLTRAWTVRSTRRP